MRARSPRRLLGPWLLCLCWPRGAAGVEAAGSVEISPRGAAVPARPRRAKVMRRERHASLTADGAAVGVGYRGATEKLEENQDAEESQDSWVSSDAADDDVEPRGGEENEGQEDGGDKGEHVSLGDEGGGADRGEEEPGDGTGPRADGEDGQGGEQEDAPALVKAPFHFVHFSGPANRVCKGHSLWTGKVANEDECEQNCANLDTCRFISLSSSNWCRLTATCHSTSRQDGKKVLIFSRSVPALVQATPEPTEAETTEATPDPTEASGTDTSSTDDKATPEPTEAETTEATPDPTEASGTDAGSTDDKDNAATPEPTEAKTTEATPDPTEASGTDAGSTDDKDNASNTTEAAKVNATDNATNETEAVKVNATDNATNETEVAKVNVSNTSKEDVFAQQCQDQADPGIEFVNGTTATCPMLRHYCHHPQFGELVRDNCPKACGFCAVELEEDSTDNKSNASTCRDGEPSELPRYEEAGRALSCTMLQHYCELDVSVKIKCKRTCGWCDNPGEALRPDSELIKANKTNATDDTAEGWGAAYNSCSRRRLLGFCHSRRRRVA